MQPERRYFLRREADRDPGLDREDLFLLMESYRNTIELNTTLLERQDALTQILERIANEVETVKINQADIKKTVDGNRKDETAEHSRHTIRLYAAFAALTTIILALIGIILKLWPHI